MTQTTALALTLALELGTLALIRPLLGRPAWGRLLLAGAAASLLTHPFAWWGAQALPLPWSARFTVVELGVVLVEIGVYHLAVPLSWRRAALASVAANVISAGTGLVWMALR